ncbi:dCTP deaminase [Bradyrhizobium sp. DASA03068]|uniref:dCTP deaminase n=1 Tax=Bradyrhizobium sp. BLXBL-01 TaxID=3395915 RepID=UPI003F70796A
MTVLGRGELLRRLRDQSLVVSPILSKRQIGAASIDLRMGNVVLMVRSRGSSHVDPAESKRSRSSSERDQLYRQQKHERYEIPFDTRFLLHPGSLALVPTLEWIKLPSNIMGNVTARSTWAREGLSIATAVLIEPNYEGIATLELANLGDIPIALYPGLRIAQIAFSLVDGDTTRPDENKSQFTLSFEPTQGDISKHDGPFIPDT